jgi:hypothetical protein
VDARTGNCSGTGTETVANNIYLGCWPTCSAVTKLLPETRRHVRSAARLDNSLDGAEVLKWLSNHGIKNILDSSIMQGALKLTKKLYLSFAKMFQLSRVCNSHHRKDTQKNREAEIKQYMKSTVERKDRR